LSHDAPGALILVIDHNGPTMFARIAMVQAINHSRRLDQDAAPEARQSVPDHKMSERHLTVDRMPKIGVFSRTQIGT
jgi:hypothetical protein